MMQLSAAAKALKVPLVGHDRLITSVGTDSRTIKNGQLFVALKGEKFDGHAYAAQALAQGAAAVMVNQSANLTGLSSALMVEDTYQALGQLATYWRSQFTAPVVAVTGSNGKTTVKEMIAAIMRVGLAQGAVLATEGNLNNHIGLPLTLLKLDAQHRYAVVEMGMNHLGEIRYLTHIGQPDVVVINNAGNAHLGELGSYEAIAEAKGEIIEGLAPNGTAVLNADDRFFSYWKNLAHGKKILSFGLNQHADVRGQAALGIAGSEVKAQTPQGEVTFNLPAPGLHNVNNALAAMASALAAGVPLAKVQEGLENFHPAKGRLQMLPSLQGAQVIDDTYNANPSSMKAAIDVLKGCKGQRILVLGDMGELGGDAPAMHAEVGAYAKAEGIDALYTLGDLSAEMSNAFGAGAKHYKVLDALVDALKKNLHADTTVLVKGSRFMAMERVVKLIAIT